MLSFTSPPRADTRIDFAIDGDTYVFRPPKSAVLIEALRVGDDPSSQLSAIMSWLGDGLDPNHEPSDGRGGHAEPVPECQACRLEHRLRDPADPLDLDTLGEVAKALVGEASARPPTNGGASPAPPLPTSTPSTGGAPPTASTPTPYPWGVSAGSSTTGQPSG